MGETRQAKSYGQLNAEQHAIIADKRFDAAHTPAEWIELLGDLADYDTVGDAQRSKVGWGCGLSIVATIVMLVVFAPLAPVPFLAAVTFMVLFTRMRKHDVPNSLRESVLPLVALLREDIDPASQLHLAVDLRPPERDENKRSSRDLTTHSYPKVSEALFECGWIAGDATLADGTTVDFTVRDLIRVRTVTKRNPRGKIKVKKKYKVRRMVEMRVALRNDQYAFQAVGATERGLRVGHKESGKRSVVKVRRMMVLPGSPQPQLDVRHVIDTLAAAYRRVALLPEEGGS